MKKYYDILGINSDSSVTQIKQAYRKLAKKYHPDINKSANASNKFIEINEAYEMLLYSHLKKTDSSVSENDTDEDNYNEFIKKVKEEARRRAQMKYEKLQKEQEAFRESGLYDAVLLLKYIGLFVIPAFATFLIVAPIYFTIKYREIYLLIPLTFFIIIGSVIWSDIIQRRKNYFKPGKFYYTWNKIKSSIFDVKQTPPHQCFFCKGHSANAKPFRFVIIQVKSVKLENKGPMQHTFGYVRTEEKIEVPRSRKAYFVHFFISCSKILSIIAFTIFFPVESIIWRTIIGLIAGWLFSFIILMLTKTKSKTGYLFSPIFVVKLTFWLIFLIVFSTFSFTPLTITTTDYIAVLFFAMFLLDSVLEQLLKMQKYNWFKPYLKPYKTLDCFTNNNFLYLEIPIWTFIYPIIRWIF